MAPKAPALGTAVQNGMPAALAPLKPDELAAGTLAGSRIRGGSSFTDTLTGVFYPIVIDPAGNITINSSANHVSSFVFHDTAQAVTDVIDYTNNLVRVIGPNSATTIPFLMAIIDRNTVTGANGIEVDTKNRRIYFLSNGGGANAAITWDNTSAVTLTGTADFVGGQKITHGSASLAAATGAPGTANSTISFGYTYGSAPDVIISVESVSPTASFQYVQALADTITTTNFRYLLLNWGAGVTETVVIHWIAIGSHP